MVQAPVPSIGSGIFVAGAPEISVAVGLDGPPAPARGNTGTIPYYFLLILDRLRINGDGWLETVRNFGRWFKRGAGRARLSGVRGFVNGRRWYQGQHAARIAFH